MKNLVKLASFGLYILSILVCFILGIYYAKLIDAGKGAMLAAGAIVLSYGILFALGGFLLALIAAYKFNVPTIKKINYVLIVLLLGLYGYNFYKYSQKGKENEDPPMERKKTVTPSTDAPNALLIQPWIFSWSKTTTATNAEQSMGFFSPNFYEHPTLYFYGNINFEKSLMDHPKVDSITFKRNKFNQFEIATAPPWLVPEHLKLDYDMLYFKVVSISEEFAEVIVNNSTGQTSFVDKTAGKILLWPDFLLRVHSVEFLPDSKEKVLVKPLEYAGTVNTPFSFLKPLRIKGDWMQVILYNDNYDSVGKGWIRWRRGEKLTILYNLLS